MAFQHGKATAVIGDEIALTGYLNQVQATGSVQTVSTTVFGLDDETFIAGLGSGSLSLSGLFDGGANASDVEFNSALAAASGKVVTVGHGGLTIGNGATLLSGRLTGYNVQAPHNDAVRLSATWDADGGVRGGVSLHDLEAETATGNFTAVDNTSSTAFGGVGHLHVTAFTGTSIDIRIQDSPDNAIWTDLITFTSVTGVTQERSTVTGTVDRYVRAIINAGTFTSCTFTVAFARNYR